MDWLIYLVLGLGGVYVILLIITKVRERIKAKKGKKDERLGSAGGDNPGSDTDNK